MSVRIDPPDTSGNKELNPMCAVLVPYSMYLTLTLTASPQHPTPISNVSNSSFDNFIILCLKQ